MFSCHRAAWFLHYGKIPNQIDHINGVKTDNAISNLRDVTHQENGKTKEYTKQYKWEHLASILIEKEKMGSKNKPMELD